MSIKDRNQKFYNLSTELSQIKDVDLRSLLKNSLGTTGWGSNHLIELSDEKVFVKKVPLTQLEYDNSFDTANLYRLPLYYNYGVGSAGFGAFRELVTHIKTTNWVLSGEIDNFPLLYHYRIVSRYEKPKAFERKKHADYIKRWNGNPSIDRYIRERYRSDYELVLFLEHFPHTLGPWLSENTSQIETISQQLYKAVRFLNDRGILHFDLHLWNILVDGRIPYISDFGLAIDQDFLTSKKEKEFFNHHKHYDFAELIGSLGMILESQYQSLNKKSKDKLKVSHGITGDMTWVERGQRIIDGIDEVKKMGVFEVDAKYIRFLKTHRNLILLMNDFFWEQRRNPKKNTKFDAQKLRAHLKKTHL